jgi:hypothetical protein
MNPVENRRHPRRRVSRLAAQVASGQPKSPVTVVVDLSEGGACLEWSVSDDIRVGSPVCMRFLLAADQTIDVDGRVVRIGAGHAGIEFSDEQRDVIRQLLAEARSDD